MGINMNLLKNELNKQIPILQNDIKKLISEKGEQKISEVTVAQAYSGLRGIKAFVCDTSSVSAEKGLIIRGIPLLEMTHISPEEVFIASCSGSGCHSFQSLSETELISSGRVVVGDPLNSSIYYRLIGSEGSGIKNMPLTGGSLTDDELDLIYTWIQEM